MLSGAVYSAHHPLRCRTELAVSFSHHYNSSRFGDFDANAHIYDILERLLFAEICLLRCVIVDVVRYHRHPLHPTYGSTRFLLFIYFPHIHRRIQCAIGGKCARVTFEDLFFTVSVSWSRYMWMRFIHF